MRIVVAMSGGVDSSVAAGLLVEQGHDVVGVHMKLHDVPSAVPGRTRRCCGYDDALDARRVADHLDIPFYVANLREEFGRAVIDDFVNEYAAGRTPNPCVRCNGVLKFRLLLQRAVALGAEKLATGHYARTEGGRLRVARDADKDQSYFLWSVPASALRCTLFPLGELTKGEVRAHAERLGLVVADKPESMEVCFLPDGDHARLVREHRPELDGSGDVVDERGNVLGRHDGYFAYTVGQRRGLGVATGSPAYVVRVEPGTRRVVLGASADLIHHQFSLRTDPFPDGPFDGMVQVRVRHRGHLARCRVHGRTVEVLDPLRAVTAGQSAVFYDGEWVVGGGTIASVADASDTRVAAP
jgi:tRNA-specific 2-thiouridylase